MGKESTELPKLFDFFTKTQARIRKASTLKVTCDQSLKTPAKPLGNRSSLISLPTQKLKTCQPLTLRAEFRNSEVSRGGSREKSVSQRHSINLSLNITISDWCNVSQP